MSSVSLTESKKRPSRPKLKLNVQASVSFGSDSHRVPRTGKLSRRGASSDRRGVSSDRNRAPPDRRGESSDRRGSTSGRGEAPNWWLDGNMSKLDLRADVPAKLQTKVRTKWMKAAMPGPPSRHQIETILQQTERSSPRSSRSPSPTRHPSPTRPSSPTEYPWETRITLPPPAPPPLPPPRKLEMQANLSDEEWATQIASLLRCPRLLIARKVGGMAKGANTPPPVDQEQAKADKKTAAAQAAAEANAAAIEEAVRLALENANGQPLKTAAEWAALQITQLPKRAVLQTACAELEATKESTLKRKFGIAMVKRKISTGTLMKEWDLNGDCSLSKEEFVKAVQRSLKLHATVNEIHQLFDSFDEDKSGTITINELDPFLREIHDFEIQEALREKLSKSKLAFYELQLTHLNEVLTATQEWESLHKQREEHESKNTIIEELGKVLQDKLSETINAKPVKGADAVQGPPAASSIRKALTEQLAGKGQTRVCREGFIKFAVQSHREIESPDGPSLAAPT